MVLPFVSFPFIFEEDGYNPYLQQLLTKCSSIGWFEPQTIAPPDQTTSKTIAAAHAINKLGV
jgi:hypothetical protein